MKYLFLLIILCSCVSHERRMERNTLAYKALLSQNDQRLQEVVFEEQAAFTLVHLRQRHYSNLYTQFVLKRLKASQDPAEIAYLKKHYMKLINNVERVQAEIAFFLERQTYDCLYAEGLPYPQHYTKKNARSYVENNHKLLLFK